MEKLYRPDPLDSMAEFRYYAINLPGTLKMVKLLILSDLHLGNPSCSLKHFRQVIQYVLSDPEIYVMFNGDLAECVTKNSKGDIYEQWGSPQKQRNYIIKMLRPIADRILGFTSGNHEDRIYDLAGIDITEDIAKEFGVPYRSEGMMLKLSFGSGNSGHEERPWVYWIYCTHGYGGARTKSAKAVKAERLAGWLHADLYAMSHDHVVNAAPDIYLLPDPRTSDEYIKDEEGLWVKSGFRVGRMQAHRKILVKTNAFLKWGGYAEKLGFPPSDLTTPLIKLDGAGRKRVRVEI